MPRATIHDQAPNIFSGGWLPYLITAARVTPLKPKQGHVMLSQSSPIASHFMQRKSQNPNKDP